MAAGAVSDPNGPKERWIPTETMTLTWETKDDDGLPVQHESTFVAGMKYRVSEELQITVETLVSQGKATRTY